MPAVESQPKMDENVSAVSPEPNHEQPAQVEEEEVLSGTDDEAADDEEDQQEQDVGKELDKKHYTGNIIDDDHPDVYEADADLTKNIPIDTDYIELIHLKIRSLKDLQLGRFKNAESICLRQNLLESVSDVKHYNAEKLVELDLYDNRIDHISSHINELVNLTTLDLSFNKIKNIKNLDNLVKLENLYLIQNKISDIKNLSTLQNLKNLELGGNRIQTISAELLTLPSIEKLWLGKNRITKLENLDKLKNLKILSIQSNRISKIEGLEHCENLEEFYISHNNLTKLEGLDKNVKLTTIDITGNKIQKLENLDHLEELTDLWASSNLIEDFENIGQALKNCKQIDTVYFENNPVHLKNLTSYRRKIKLYLNPSLTKIDATYIQ
ncbi:type 1 protein phosphatase-activating protein [Saccharomycopsis crataegensis]|uniref:Type 1 protein phosphatase-activating protein n=1 Tax=Saccharomycopsis crataegensis TaxID=43959 RepID=A0AAV5QQ71_9ASCO|nr:type 1 protein phosphatase-activating protein [Saccharomycopsis crataegensis]